MAVARCQWCGTTLVLIGRRSCQAHDDLDELHARLNLIDYIENDDEDEHERRDDAEGAVRAGRSTRPEATPD